MRNILGDTKAILIYGAMVNARNVVNLIDWLYPGKLVGLAVSDMTGNADEIFGHEVRAIDDYEGILDKENTLVIIAMRQSLVNAVKKSLSERGYHFSVSFCEEEEILRHLPEEILDRFKSYANLKNFLMVKRIKDTFAGLRGISGGNER